MKGCSLQSTMKLLNMSQIEMALYPWTLVFETYELLKHYIVINEINMN